MKVRRFLLVILIFFLFLLINTKTIFAESSYVLPYPSVMPGSILYKPRVLFDKLLSYWYFGNIAQFEYNLKQSDKFLVEAKTLFEYKQYLLGIQALQKSDKYFKNVSPYLLKAEKQGKDITDKKAMLQSAAQKHIEVLQQIRSFIPPNFYWNPENGNPVQLELSKNISLSISIRNPFL